MLTKLQIALQRPAEPHDKGCAMKKLFFILLASLALLVAHDSNKIHADDDGGGIPLSRLTGKYATTGQGSVTVCFKPDFSATEPCSTKGVVAISGNSQSVGQVTTDLNSNCSTNTTTFGFPGDPSPTIGSVAIGVTKLISYDPATGSGDLSFTNYTGGKCVGSKFDSTGATVLNTGTAHFVVSNGGERSDTILTTLTDPVGDLGAFNLSGSTLKQ
jgi:hypothetical protein